MPSETINAPADKSGERTGLNGLRLIAVIKVVKAVLLTGVAFGIFHSINKDLGETVRQATFKLRIDPENHLIRLLLEKLARVEPRTLRTVGWISSFYACALYAEGVGLWLNQAWAKYMLLLATGAFIPEEAYICIRRYNGPRLCLLIFNVIVLGYVIWILWAQRGRRKPR